MHTDPKREPHDSDHDHRDTTAPTDDSPDVPFTIGPLVDALSSGAAPPPDDELARLLAGWRDDITTDLDDPPREPLPAAPGQLARVVALRPRHQPHPAGRRRFARATVAGVAALTVLVGGASVGAASWTSTPDSPLWPVAEVLYPDHAHAVAIEDTIARARRALRAGNHTHAADLINLARAQLDAADLPENTAVRLRSQVDALISDLAELADDTDGSLEPRITPPPAGSPPAPPTTTADTRTSAPTQPTPTPTTSDLPLLPLPGLSPRPRPTPSATPHSSPSPTPSSGGGLCLALLPCLLGAPTEP